MRYLDPNKPIIDIQTGDFWISNSKAIIFIEGWYWIEYENTLVKIYYTRKFTSDLHGVDDSVVTEDRMRLLISDSLNETSSLDKNENIKALFDLFSNFDDYRTILKYIEIYKLGM